MVLMAILVSPSTSVLPSAQAASGCEGQVAAPEWNTSLQHMALVPHWSSPYAFDPYYGEPVYATEGRDHEEYYETNVGDLDPAPSPRGAMGLQSNLAAATP